MCIGNVLLEMSNLVFYKPSGPKYEYYRQEDIHYSKKTYTQKKNTQ